MKEQASDDDGISQHRNFAIRDTNPDQHAVLQYLEILGEVGSHIYLPLCLPTCRSDFCIGQRSLACLLSG